MSLIAQPPFDTVQQINYHEAVQFVIHRACHELDDELHVRRPRTQDDLTRAIITTVIRAFEAGAIWRDFNPDAPMGPES